jgi:UDP-N-acetylmuramoyl-L-alanyl-D-glutamate--2,6-diaminopimelate ligase
MPKELDELIQDLPVTKIVGDKRINIAGIAYHSQKVKPNFLFVAIDGSKTSGSKFIDEALMKGAVVVASNQAKSINSPRATYVQVENPRIFFAQVSHKFYNYPAQRLNLIGITGTNGKTTSAYLAKSILDTAGKTSGLLGTIRHFDGENWLKAENTTPESLDIIQILAKLVQKGMKYCILEVSSHGLELNRVFGLRFQIGVFTNLTQDHLDFHKTLEAYKKVKLKLFAELDRNAFAVVNKDDAVADEINKITKAPIIYYGLKNQAEITAKILNLAPNITNTMLNIEGKELRVDLRLIGSHNVYNLMAAAGVGLACQIPLNTIKAGIEKAKNIPGRLELVENNKGIVVFVDYAHSPDALKNLITTAREFSKKRVLILFGCGGNRDQSKRPIMGRIATELADQVVITSDNPRNEDPNKIIEDIKVGINKSNFEIIPDRYAAIKRILLMAKTGDTVLIAGKGHEDYQIIGDEKKHFDDRTIVKRFLES